MDRVWWWRIRSSEIYTYIDGRREGEFSGFSEALRRVLINIQKQYSFFLQRSSGSVVGREKYHVCCPYRKKSLFCLGIFSLSKIIEFERAELDSYDI